MSNCKPEAERFFDKVDKRPDGCWVWTARIDPSNGYGYFGRAGRTTGSALAHRWSYLHHRGEIPDGLVIDHICHNRACVNPDHLRPVTQGQNLQNMGVLSSKNTTGYRGVWFCKRTQRYGAQIYVDNKPRFLGRYATADEAGEVARQARLAAYTHNDLDRLAS